MSRTNDAISGSPAGKTLVHEAFLYAGLAEYLDGVGGFIQAALAAGDPIMVAVPRTRLDLLRVAIRSPHVRYTDMTELGRNPSCIIPHIRAFIDEHRGRHVRFVGEPIWAERTVPETIEATRHEALINLAFGSEAATILCPYDATGLAAPVLAHAMCTHPTFSEGGQRWASDAYADPATIYATVGEPLPLPPPTATTLSFGRDLGAVREFVRQQATGAGLGGTRVDNLVLASHEAASNTLVHSAGGGTLRTWLPTGEIVCEIAGGGQLHDPLAGRILPTEAGVGGRGLWLINHLCDLTELRTNHAGTTIRLHMTLRPAG